MELDIAVTEMGDHTDAASIAPGSVEVWAEMCGLQAQLQVVSDALN